jgi:hypothetical protein
MRRSLLACLSLLVLAGCSGTKTDSSAAMPAVALYPGSEIVVHGENNDSIGLSFKVKAPLADVKAHFCKELGTTEQSGAITAVKNGHTISVIVTNPLNGPETTGSIVEKKHL